MKVNELIVNQYEDHDFLKYNQVKYKTICIVLDFFAVCNGLESMTSIERDVVEKKIFASVKPTKKEPTDSGQCSCDYETNGLCG